MHNIHLLYNKTIIDLCFGRHGVLLNSKLNHIDLRSASVNMTLKCSIALHVHLNISQQLYIIAWGYITPRRDVI